MTQNQKGLRFWFVVLSVLALLTAATLLLKPTQFHPVLVFKIADSLQITFVQEAKASRNQCEGNVTRITKALQQNCPICRLLENRCIENLDPLQRKILGGQPIDAPVMRVPGGAIAFSGAAMDFAFHACRE